MGAAKMGFEFWLEGEADINNELFEVNPCTIPESAVIAGGKVVSGGGAIFTMEPTTKYRVRNNRLVSA